jgi:hypothetical protein
MTITATNASDATTNALHAEVERYRTANERISRLSLRLVAELTIEALPDAVGVKVNETDQDHSGALTFSGIVLADGTELDYDEAPDGVEEDLFDPLINLDEGNSDTWTEYLVGSHSESSGTSGYLDLVRILVGVPSTADLIA